MNFTDAQFIQRELLHDFHEGLKAAVEGKVGQVLGLVVS